MNRNRASKGPRGNAKRVIGPFLVALAASAAFAAEVVAPAGGDSSAVYEILAERNLGRELSDVEPASVHLDVPPGTPFQIDVHWTTGRIETTPWIPQPRHDGVPAAGCVSGWAYVPVYVLRHSIIGWATSPPTPCLVSAYQVHQQPISTTALSCMISEGRHDCFVDGLNRENGRYGYFLLYCTSNPVRAAVLNWPAVYSVSCYLYKFGAVPTSWRSWDSWVGSNTESTAGFVLGLHKHL